MVFLISPIFFFADTRRIQHFLFFFNFFFFEKTWQVTTLFFFFSKRSCACIYIYVCVGGFDILCIHRIYIRGRICDQSPCHLLTFCHLSFSFCIWSFFLHCSFFLRIRQKNLKKGNSDKRENNPARFRVREQTSLINVSAITF